MPVVPWSIARIIDGDAIAHGRSFELRASDGLRLPATHALELVRVGIQLGATYTAPSQDLADEHETSRLEQKVVDRAASRDPRYAQGNGAGLKP